MENDFDEVDANPHNPNRIRISVTRASFSEEEGEPEGQEIYRPRADSDSSIDEKEMEKLLQEDENNENEQLQNGGGGRLNGHNDSSSNDGVKDSRTSEDEEVRKAFENGVTVSEDSASERRESAEKSNDEASESQQRKNSEDSRESPEKSPAMEMIGDRVLIERDGKFELVDVSEIKAEYYDMLGISHDGQANKDDQNNGSEGTDSETAENNGKDIEDEKPEPRTRPKTTSVHELHRRNEKKRTDARASAGVDRNRSQSAKAIRQRNDEYSYIRSPYAMTEQQLEIRRKCREAKLRRQKEEQEREREEQQRKKEDADRAFQVSLNCLRCYVVGKAHVYFKNIRHYDAKHVWILASSGTSWRFLSLNSDQIASLKY